MSGEKSKESGKSVEWKRRIEVKRGGGDKKGKGKSGRSSKAELLGRERSWSVESGRSIDEFFLREKGRKRR